MKFRCDQQILSKAMNTVSVAVSNRTTLPVLKGILMTAEGGEVTLSASDLDISICTKIDATVEEEGSAVVMAKLFGDIIRKLPNEEVKVEKEKEDSVKINTNSSEFHVISLPVDEFPEIGKREEGDRHLSIDKNILRKMIKKTSFAASNDESKGVLTGILTEINEEDMTMVALDGFRLALATEEMRSESVDRFIISSSKMNEVGRIIGEDNLDEEYVDIYLGSKRAVLNIGRTEMIIRMMEGEFIKYRDIIPEESKTRVIVGREVFISSIERASLLSREGKNNLIKLTIEGEILTITSRSEEGNVKEEMGIEKEGNDIEIGFNSKYMMDALKEIEDEKICLYMNTSVTPCVVRPTEGKSIEYLILPVRIPAM